MRSSGHRTVTVDVDAENRSPRTLEPRIPWWLIAGAGGVLVVLAGWLLVAGGAVLGWLASDGAPLSQVAELASSVVVLAHGATVTVAGQQVSLAPLGLSLVLVLLGQPLAAQAARQAHRVIDDQWAVLGRVAGVMALGWAAAVVVLATLAPSVVSFAPAVLGAVVMAGASALWGVTRELHLSPTASWPRWVRSVPWAMAGAVLVCLVGGGLVLTAALAGGTGRMAAIHDGLQPDAAGSVVLVVLQLLYLPNLLVWAASWVVGAGLTLGDDSLVSIGVTDAGFLPAIPVLGALPEAGSGSPTWFWWLVVGVLAGALAAFVVAWLRPGARFDETTLVGGLSAVAAGLCLAVLAWISGGSLGTGRLSHVGPDVWDVAVVAPSLMGLTGVLVGLATGLVRRPRRADAAHEVQNIDNDTDEEPMP